MYRPTTTRAALVLATLIGCGGSIPEDTLVQEADPVALSATTLPMTAPLESIEESADAAPEFLAASNTEIDPGLDSSSDSGTAPSVEIEGDHRPHRRDPGWTLECRGRVRGSHRRCKRH